MKTFLIREKTTEKLKINGDGTQTSIIGDFLITFWTFGNALQ